MIERVTHERIVELRLNRPPVNALSPALLQAIADEVRGAPERGAQAVVVSGGDGVFSAGLDLPLLVELERDALRAALETFFDAMHAVAASAVPVAMAMTGHSPAAAAILAMFGDWRVMAAGDFRVGLNEVRIGLPMPEVVFAVAARTVGERHAERMCVTGELMPPDDALRIGLIDALAPPEQVVAEAVGWCRARLEVPQNGLAETRSTVRRGLVELLERHRTRDVDRLAERWFEPELQAVLRAVVDDLKRR
jgi:enoyl-CoA hydratase/carnithine racemase